MATRSKRSQQIDLKLVRRRVIFWTAIAVIVVYSILFFFASATNAYADAEGDCKAKTDGSKWSSELDSCRTLSQQCTDKNANNVWVDKNGNGSDGKNYAKKSAEYCWYSSNHGCGTDTFFDWGCDDSGNEQVTPLLITIINWLAVGVSIVVIAGIIYGGIIYTTSGGNPEQAKRAISIIRNAIIALLMFFAMWSLLNFLTPGGMFN
jgi:hypothetical protein